MQHSITLSTGKLMRKPIMHFSVCACVRAASLSDRVLVCVVAADRFQVDWYSLSQSGQSANIFQRT